MTYHTVKYPKLDVKNVNQFVETTLDDLRRLGLEPQPGPTFPTADIGGKARVQRVYDAIWIESNTPTAEGAILATPKLKELSKRPREFVFVRFVSDKKDRVRYAYATDPLSAKELVDAVKESVEIEARINAGAAR